MHRYFTMASLVMAFAMTAGYLFFRERMDSRVRALNETIGSYESCGNLRLGMTREDVLRFMGPPKKEFQSTGPGGGAAVALLFPTALENDRFPMVTLERGRLTDAFCTENMRLTATADEIAEMFAREDAAQAVIGTDRARR